MAARFCSFCGQPLPGQGTFCPSCGAAVPGSVGPGAAPSPMPTFLPPPGYYPVPGTAPPGPGGPAVGTQSQDRSALFHVTLAAILTLVGVIVGFASSAIVSNLGGLISTTSGTSGVVLSLPSPWVWVGLIGVSAVIQLAGYLMFRSAFHTLTPVDRRFSTPATLALIAVGSFIAVLVGLALILGALYQAVQCVGSGNPITQACLFTSTFWGGLALVAVGAIVFIVGYIGILIGIWRLGTRYSETVFKVGAVLLLIPVLNVVGAILILVGAQSATRKIP